MGFTHAGITQVDVTVRVSRAFNRVASFADQLMAAATSAGGLGIR